MTKSTKDDSSVNIQQSNSDSSQNAGEDNEPINAEDMQECMGKSMEVLSTTFAASAKRWESIVYPSLFAFILLAAYGFFLIYNLTRDVRRVADNMETIVTHMEQMSVNMSTVSHNMVLMTQTIDTQSVFMGEMTMHMRGMNVSMGQMRYDMSVMNNNVSRPMSFMNTFMPW